MEAEWRECIESTFSEMHGKGRMGDLCRNNGRGSGCMAAVYIYEV